MISGNITHAPKVTFEMIRPFTWEEMPYVIGSWESVISSLCELLCVFCLGITAHCEDPANHFLIYYASCQITVRVASLPEEQGADLGPPAAAEPGSLPFSQSICLPWCGGDGRIPASQPCGVSCQAL